MAPLRRAGACAAGVVLILVLGGCHRQRERWNVLFLVVDTLRADRMSLYGYGRRTTPRLEALARQGVVFDNARSQAACTFPSVNSLLTSREPATFVNGGAGMAIPDGVRSLPEVLREAGYATAAVSASLIVRQTPSRWNPNGGFGRGFAAFDESCLQRSARCVDGRLFGLFGALREPWLLYAHYLEPHAPYRPPAEHALRFAAAPERARALGVHAWARRGDSWQLARRLYDGDTSWEFNDEDLRHLSDLYDDETLYFDEELGRLFAELRRRALLDHTIVVLTSDHGEELYDHRHYNHCRDIAYETVLHTPMLVWIPDVAGARRRALVENLDLVPTVVDYLGLSPKDPFVGKSLRPVIERDAPIRQLSFGMQGVVRTVTDGKLKLSYDLTAGRAQLFDLSSDPQERVDRSAELREASLRLEGALLRWVERLEGPTASGNSRRRAEEVEQQLRALGYL